MKVFSISDLHMSGTNSKPMDIFGDHWEDHMEKIEEDWINVVGDDDIVLVPGDISWAMHLKDAIVDLERLGKLPGRKVILKGNHDYWWSSITKIRELLPDGFYALQNDSIRIGNLVVAGTRGWKVPGSKQFVADDEKLYNREVQRLKLSLKSSEKIIEETDKLIVMFHYPPTNENLEKSELISLVNESKPVAVLYGHIHNLFNDTLLSGLIDEVEYHLVSCDYLNFKLKLILEI